MTSRYVLMNNESMGVAMYSPESACRIGSIDIVPTVAVTPTPSAVDDGDNSAPGQQAIREV